ncbi:SpoIIE family protein phosphatase [Halanaerobacter jeridensis]|uniref:PAS domain S-box-containing protein n=1 Tax=Halanaerobacter jeridensis TaxID=706427 RepID=A0A938XT70_9FIRM|nr:PAS domain S-box protein [Halanaerobacter jeridensis]MBM7557384.1 PAS domain S-box-containing protein [Halanaerobacter jeridensis]
MKDEEELNKKLIAGLKLRHLLYGNIFYILLSVLFASMILMTGYELLKELIFSNLTAWGSHLITIIFVSSLITILFSLIIIHYRNLWTEVATKINNYGQDLKEERDKLATYIETAPYGVFVVDENGNYLEVNGAATEIAGYSEEELLEMNILDLHPYLSKERVGYVFSQIKNRKQFKQEMPYTTKSGEQRWFSIKVVKLSETRFLGFVEDITERKNIMQDLKMKNKAIQESATAFVFSDQEGQLTEVNQSFLKMWDYQQPEEILGQTPMALHPEEEREKVERSMQYIKKEGSWQGELKGLRSDGSLFDINISCTALKDNQDKVQGMMASFIDITERKETEERLREKKDQLHCNFEELMVTKQQLAAANDLLVDQIKSAKEIHNQLLTRNFPQVDDYFMSGIYQPAEHIGGDFYYAIELENEVVFYLADITGHSLDGAFLNVFLRETIDNYLFSHSLRTALSPAEIVEFVTDRYQEENFTADYFISLVLFVLDKESKEIKYTNFGFQVLPLLVKSGGVEELNLTGLPISTAIDREKYEFKEEVFKLEQGDKLVVTTDGLVEEQIEKQRYGTTRLKEIIEQNQQLPLEFVLEKINFDFQNFITSQDQKDDVSILGIEREEVIDKIELCIASDFELLKQVKEQFLEFVAPYTNQGEMLVMGFHEMLINAIEHGNQGDISCQVEIFMLVTSNYIKLVIKDEGRGFHWDSKLQQGLDQSDFTERGRGIAITEEIWDKICYNYLGNKVVLYQSRSEI